MSFDGLCRLIFGRNAGDGTHAETGDRAVSDVTLKPFDCLDREFESRGRHGCLSFVSVTFFYM